MKRFLFIFIAGLFVISFLYSEVNFDYGFYLRLRQEYWKNLFDLNNQGTLKNDNFFRLKSSLWGKWKFTDDLSLFSKLTNEAKYYVVSRKGETFHSDEIVFDNLYLDIKNIFGLPVDVRIGRQDFLFTYGEGFLIMDGTPMDGSRTFYFNAIKSSWKINDKNTLDFVYIDNPRTDIYLPYYDFDGEKQVLNTSDESGFILYGKSKINNKFSVEPYYIYKVEDATDSTPKLTIRAIGTRGVYNSGGWGLRGELAYEFGEYEGGNERNGIGGYLFYSRQFKNARFSPSFEIGFVYLSGDDPNSPDNEGWNPLFSRWPWLSELYILTYAPETGIPAYWTNLQLYRTSLKLQLSKKASLNLWYNYLKANEYTAGSIFSNTGKERGHLPQLMFKYKFTKDIDGYILTEYFIPGDFYVDTSDSALFFRWQLQFKF